jgi:hypothetical protein
MQNTSTFKSMTFSAGARQSLSLIEIYWQFLARALALETITDLVRARPPPHLRLTSLNEADATARSDRQHKACEIWQSKISTQSEANMDIAICGVASSVMPPYIGLEQSRFSRYEAAFLGLETTFQAAIIARIRSTESRLLDSSLV